MDCPAHGCPCLSKSARFDHGSIAEHHRL